MVRRVRPGRRAVGWRPRGWVGPPPVLVLVTLLALVVAPAVAQDPAAPGASTRGAAHLAAGAAATPRSVEPRIVRQQVLPARAGQRIKGAKPVRLAPITVGVASYNMFRKDSLADARADVRRLTSRRDVDVVGWQEADPFHRAFDRPGWSTRTFRHGRSYSELAVSWRSSEFRLVSAREHKVALGLSWREGRYPFGTRYVAVVRLEHIDSGRVLTVLDTHLPQKIEDRDHLGRWMSTINSIRARAQLRRMAAIWRQAEGRWTVATGDFNFGARADARERPSGGLLRVLGRVATSSYQQLGSGIGPTHPPTARNIDYVWMDRTGVRRGEVAALSQRVLSGYHSDHRPLLARLRLG